MANHTGVVGSLPIVPLRAVLKAGVVIVEVVDT